MTNALPAALSKKVELVDTYGNELRSVSDMPKAVANLEPEQARTLTQLFDTERAKAIIKPLLPKGVTYEEVYAETAHVVAQNAELLECTKMSLVYAVARAVQTGLTIGEKVFIVPFDVKVSKRNEPDRYEKRAQKVTGYRGEMELILSCHGAKQLNALCVYQNEIDGKHGGHFGYVDGSSPEIMHRRILDPKERGPMIGAYAAAWTATGVPPKIVFLHITEIDAIRKKCSRAWKSLEVCPPWYAKKTVVHQIAKELPMSMKLRNIFRAIEVEDSEADAEALAA